MSRWSNFKVEEIRQQISDIQIRLENLNSLDPSITAPMPDFPFEIARAREVLSFIDDYLKSIKPHLLRSGYSSQDIVNQLNNISNNISQFQVNKNFGHIMNINNSIDNILLYLSQNTFPTIQKHKTSNSLSSLIQSYEQNIGNSLTKLNLSETQDKINLILNAYQEICSNTQESIFSKVKQTKSEIEKKLTETEKLKTEVQLKHNLICIDDEKNKSLATQVSEAKNNITQILKDIQTKRDIFQEEYKNVFGDEQKQGIKQEFESAKQSYIDELEQKIKELDNHNKTIERVFKKAISGGLSDSYAKQAKSSQRASWFWFAVFIIALGGIIGISTWAYLDIAHHLASIKELEKNINASNLMWIIGFGVFARFTLAIPLVWLAIYASTRRVEAQRLQEEYNHKVALSMSYLSHRDEIEKINQDDSILLQKLLDSTITTFAFNPTSTLDQTSKSKNYKNILKETKEVIGIIKDIVKKDQ